MTVAWLVKHSKNVWFKNVTLYWLAYHKLSSDGKASRQKNVNAFHTFKGHAKIPKVFFCEMLHAILILQKKKKNLQIRKRYADNVIVIKNGYKFWGLIKITLLKSVKKLVCVSIEMQNIQYRLICILYGPKHTVYHIIYRRHTLHL